MNKLSLHTFNILLLDGKSWRQFFGEVFRNPQNYVVWLIVFLVVLFLLARMRNIMEERSVNRAIYISRGLVGSFIAFLVTPIVFYILLNLVALVHGVSTIDISFLVKWIGLTLSSYWWLLKCFFGSESLSGATEMYSVDSIIRILWVTVPFSFIWLRMSKTRVGMLLLIPLIVGILVITRYKKAPSTFITEDRELVAKIPFLSWFIDNPDAPYTERSISLEQRKMVATGLLLFVLAGFGVGLYFKKRIIGLILSAIGILGFILMAPHEQEKVIPESHHEHYHANVDSLIHQMNHLHEINPDTLEIYNISLKVQAAYIARMQMGDMIRFPDSLCVKYQSYFFDWCKDKQN